ncbi:hypothetical protein LWI29_018247 [Acer saccharum]|uniref:Uncharacterized protein n=1 Tax=Acer saccharum TaxID=4024 RepID=A0AA39SR22_ACESA|nr:hypothetical protein LWI29_018247 [Acer saccharum]
MNIGGSRFSTGLLIILSLYREMLLETNNSHMNKLLNSPNLLNNQVDDTIIGHNADSLSFQKLLESQKQSYLKRKNESSKNVNYFVDMHSVEMKVLRVTDDKLQLLHKVTATFMHGVVTVRIL